jgi:hypothetical protein
VGKAVYAEQAHVAAGAAVGEDVAGAEVVGDFVEGRRAEAYVDHEGELDAVGQFPGPHEGADAGAAGGVAVDAGFDAEDDVRVAGDDLGGEVDVAVVEVGELPGGGDEADRGEVEEGEDADAAALGDPAAEGGEGVGAGAADVEPGGDAGAGGDGVGLDAPVGGAPVDVGVEVDQAGG